MTDLTGYGDRPWRTGRKVGRTIYDAHDQLIGIMDTKVLAGLVVTAVNTLAATDKERGERVTDGPSEPRSLYMRCPYCGRQVRGTKGQLDRLRDAGRCKFDPPAESSEEPDRG